MVSDNFFAKLTTINFVVKNTAPQGKRITIFNYPIESGATRDLMAIPGVSEATIRESLIKGDLANKIRMGQLIVVSSSIDLLQFDPEQKAFLSNAGVSEGLTPAPSDEGSSNFYVFSPGNPSPTDSNVYTDWPTLYAAAIASYGPIFVDFDDTYADPEIPAGTYDMSNFNWSGPIRASGNNVDLQLNDGCVFNQLPAYIKYLDIYAQATSNSVVSINSELQFVNLTSSSLGIGFGGFPFCTLSGGSLMVFCLSVGSRLNNGDNTIVYLNDNDSGVIVYANGYNSGWDSEVVVGPGGFYGVVDANVSISQIYSVSNYSISFSDQLSQLGNNINNSYFASAVASPEDAINRMAAAISGLLGGTIP